MKIQIVAVEMRQRIPTVVVEMRQSREIAAARKSLLLMKIMRAAAVAVTVVNRRKERYL